MKVQLKEFAEEIAPECGIPEISFGVEGIAKHIQSFFNEQRRYGKRLAKKRGPVCEKNMHLLIYYFDLSVETDPSTVIVNFTVALAQLHPQQHVLYSI